MWVARCVFFVCVCHPLFQRGLAWTLALQSGGIGTLWIPVPCCGPSIFAVIFTLEPELSSIQQCAVSQACDPCESRH